jgi:glycosyltransferase involved in cell wall biosynthesis
MLEGHDLLFLGSDWGRFPDGFQQIAQLLAKSNRIIWVDSLSMRRPSFQMYDVKRIIGRMIGIFSSTRKTSESILTGNIHPLIIPFNDLPGIQKVNDILLRSVLRKELKKNNFKNFIVISATPMIANIIGTLGESSSHYFCMDDYTQYDGAYRCLSQLEKNILAKVDSCFALSDPLMQTRKAKSGENHFLPMGVDIEHFNQPQEPLPIELRTVKKPIAGFIGQIGTYVDIDLILECAKAYPGVSFVVIGRPYVNVNMSVLSQASNIYFLGEIPYQKIPQYARAFDVGLNPRVVNKLSLTMNPVKILEYLSVGMPVISTDLPAVKIFEEFVYIAKSREHFIELIGTALQDSSQDKKEARKKIAQQYSWKSIVQYISEIIERIDTAKHSLEQKSI